MTQKTQICLLQSDVKNLHEKKGNNGKVLACLMCYCTIGNVVHWTVSLVPWTKINIALKIGPNMKI